MMTQPLWWRLSAGRRFAQGLADLQFKKRTRLLLVGGTMIRHASPSRTVTATSGSVHGATTWSCLIAPPSFPLVLAAGFLRAGSEAVDLATIALPTDKNLRAAATTQKQSARHFISTVRHINPPAQPQFLAASSPEPIERAAVLGPIKAKALRVAAKTRPALTGPARGGCAIWRSGRKNARGAGRTKEWNLPTQYPNRSSIFAAPHRRRHVRYQFGPPFTRAGHWERR
jgi:hypothetical protein